MSEFKILTYVVDVDYTIFRDNLLERYFVEKYKLSTLDSLNWRIRPLAVLLLTLMFRPRKSQVQRFLFEHKLTAPFWPFEYEQRHVIYLVSACFPLRLVFGTTMLGQPLHTLSCIDYLFLKKNKKTIFTKLVGRNIQTPIFVGDSLEDSLDGYPFIRV